MSSTTDRTTSQTRQTALYSLHCELGAKIVDFAGWEMPLQYPTGIMSEHKHCRNSAALFDVSHMGQLELHSPAAAQILESLVPADITNLKPGQCRYTFFTDPNGGILDDLIVTNAGSYLYIVVNASMRDQDIGHLEKHLGEGAVLKELTEQALIAVQGPAAVDVVTKLFPDASQLNFMQSGQASHDGVQCRVSRLGYTGEDGFELSVPSADADKIARALLAHEQCKPAGLGARDSLRLEAGLSLYGNDIDRTTTPVEASLSWAIQKNRREQGGYPGDNVIGTQLKQGTSRKLVGLRPEGRVPARQHAKICDASGSTIGEITSGGFGPTVGAPVAMGYIATEHASSGTDVMLSVRGKLHPATVTPLPFVPHNYKR